MGSSYPDQLTIYDFLKPLNVDIKGICDDGFCPRCDIWLDDLAKECPICGCSMNWDRWIRCNKEIEDAGREDSYKDNSRSY